MKNISFSRTSTERVGDSTISIRSMSYNVPGHQDRLKAHRERVQREYFDSGLDKIDKCKAQGGGVAEVVMARVVGWEIIDKKCHTCKKFKPIDDFFRDKDQKDGYRANCKLCQKDILKRYN